MDPELLRGSGPELWKIQSWIRIRNKSFRIHNTVYLEEGPRQTVDFYINASSVNVLILGPFQPHFASTLTVNTSLVYNI